MENSFFEKSNESLFLMGFWSKNIGKTWWVIMDQSLEPIGIVSAEAFGTADVCQWLEPIGIVSAEAFDLNFIYQALILSAGFSA